MDQAYHTVQFRQDFSAGREVTGNGTERTNTAVDGRISGLDTS